MKRIRYTSDTNMLGLQPATRNQAAKYRIEDREEQVKDRKFIVRQPLGSGLPSIGARSTQQKDRKTLASICSRKQCGSSS